MTLSLGESTGAVGLPAEKEGGCVSLFVWRWHLFELRFPLVATTPDRKAPPGVRRRVLFFSGATQGAHVAVRIVPLYFAGGAASGTLQHTWQDFLLSKRWNSSRYGCFGDIGESTPFAVYSIAKIGQGYVGAQ